MNSQTSNEFDANASPNYLVVLVRQKTFILLGTVVCILVTAMASLFLPNIYQSNAILIVQPPRFTTKLRPQTLSVQTYKQLLLNKDIVAQVLEKARSEFPQEFQSVTLEDLFKSLKVEINVETKTQSGESYSPLLTVKAENKVPAVAKRTVELWVDLFLQKARDLSSAQTLETEKFINDQFQETRKNLREAEDALTEFMQNNNIALMNENTILKTNKLVDTIKKLEETEVQLMEAKKEVRQTEDVFEVMSVEGRSLMLLDNASGVSKDSLEDFQRELLSEAVSRKKWYENMVRRKNEFNIKHKLGYMEEMNQTYHEKALGLDKELESVDYELEKMNLKLAEIEKELGRQPETRKLKKILPVEVLLEFFKDRMSREEIEQFARSWALEEESFNPVHLGLLSEKSSLVVSKNLLEQKKKTLQREKERNLALLDEGLKELKELQQEKHFLDLEYTDASEEFTRFQNKFAALQRTLGEKRILLRKLETQKEIYEKEIQKREKDLSALNARLYEALDTRRWLNREVERMNAAHNMFKIREREARSARAEETPEVKLAANPVKADEKIKPKRSIIVSVAAVVGFLISCLIVIFFDFLDRNRDEIYSPQEEKEENE